MSSTVVSVVPVLIATAQAETVGRDRVRRTTDHFAVTRHVRERVCVSSSEDRMDAPGAVVALCQAVGMAEWAQESFCILPLDTQGHVVGNTLIEITRGVLNSSLVHAREVFHAAIIARAASVILVHNHPSGDATPSAEDRLLTARLVTAGALLDIPVQDHVIIGRGRYVSFAEAGMLTSAQEYEPSGHALR